MSIRFRTVRYGNLRTLRKLYIIVPVNTHNIFDYIYISTYIGTICRHAESINSIVGSSIFGDNRHFEPFEYGLDGLCINIFTDKRAYFCQRHTDLEVIYRFRVNVDYIARYGCSRNTSNHRGGNTEYIDSVVWIHSTLEAETRVGIQSVITCRFSRTDGVEVSTLDEYRFGFLAHSRVQSSEDTCQTHRFLGIAYHQVCFCKSAFYAVESNKLLALHSVANYYLMPCYTVCIEGVKRLPKRVQHIVGNIDHIIDRA